MKVLKKGANSEINIPSSNSLVLTTGYKNKSKKDLQVDVMAMILDKSGKPKNGAHDFFFYGTGIYNNIPYGKSYSSYDGSLEMLPFDVQGTEQKIKINFDKISPDVDKIVFVQTIFNAEKEKFNFGDISSPYFKLEEQSNPEHSIYFEADDILANVVCLQLCEIYRYNGLFKIRALGQGYSKGIKAALLDYSFSLE